MQTQEYPCRVLPELHSDNTEGFFLECKPTKLWVWLQPRGVVSVIVKIPTPYGLGIKSNYVSASVFSLKLQ